MVTSLMCMGVDSSHIFLYEDNIKCQSESFKALKALREDALKRGFSLDIASSYRDFFAQDFIFSEKFLQKRAVLDKDEKEIDISTFSTYDKVKAICLFSAIPAFSRHHFGSDFDVYSKTMLPKGQRLMLTAYEYAKGAYFEDLNAYLEDNLAKFDFYRPFDGRTNIGFEPWHISYKPLAYKMQQHFDLDFALLFLQKLERPWSLAAIAYIKENYKDYLTL